MSFNLDSSHISSFQFRMLINTHLNLYKIEHVNTHILLCCLHPTRYPKYVMSGRTHVSTDSSLYTLKIKRAQI